MAGTITFYDVVLWVHITAVVTAFGALFAYPIFLAVNSRAPIAERANFHRLQIAFSKFITGPTIVVVLVAGAYLASDRHLWSRTWVIVPFILLLVIAGLGATVLRRGEQTLIACSEAGDESAYDARLAVVRNWTLLTITLIVVTIFFMSAKPFN
jgi:uncharacterized membrane protein